MANGIPSLTDKWTVTEVLGNQTIDAWRCLDFADLGGKQIVYCSIMGVVMFAALLEWFLWLAAFQYCLIKVFQKAEKWHIRVLAVVMMVLFSALR